MYPEWRKLHIISIQKSYQMPMGYVYHCYNNSVETSPKTLRVTSHILQHVGRQYFGFWWVFGFFFQHSGKLLLWMFKRQYEISFIIIPCPKTSPPQWLSSSPKTLPTTSWSGYRPINPCNVSNKIIFKFLTDRSFPS